jgi:hypothetical protein
MVASFSLRATGVGADFHCGQLLVRPKDGEELVLEVVPSGGRVLFMV